MLYIEKNNSIDSRYTGYSGKISNLWKTQNWLITHAKTSELHQLIHYKNNAVKCVVFEGLITRKDTLVFDYIVNSFENKEPVFVQSGCLGSGFGLTEYYLSKTYDKVTENSYSDKMIDGLFTQDQITILDSISKTKTRYLVH